MRLPRTSSAQRPAIAYKQATHVGRLLPAFNPAAAIFIAAAISGRLAIQHRLKAKLIYDRTGKGNMAPSGVAEIAAAKR